MPFNKSKAGPNLAVSIIVPCRNEEDSIEDCVRSILDQELLPNGIELIVADGMSTDRTRGILTRLALEDDRVRVMDNPGRIVSSGLNAAIAVSRGEITFVKVLKWLFANRA